MKLNLLTKNKKIASDVIRVIFIILLFLIVSISLYLYTINVIVSSMFGDMSYLPKEEVIKNYEINKDKIHALAHYTRLILPKNHHISLEYTSDGKIDRLELFKMNSQNETVKAIINLFDDTDIHNIKIIQAIRQINWTVDTLKTLRNKLRESNCISVTIDNRSPIYIGAGRSGLGMYGYRIYTKGLSKIEQNRQNSYCQSLVIDEKAVLEYGSGAIGSDCMPNK
ncbi:MAG: hypothetical protein IEMM0008_1326 [bacterium]|nr:MAG: hypothetical protein IEMM0008_1326 [bacterium]